MDRDQWIQRIIKQELDRCLGPKNKKVRRCMLKSCDSIFRPVKDNHYFCSPQCCRKAHYMRFNIRKIRGRPRKRRKKAA